MRGVAENKIPLDELVVDEMSFCLACRACESACPAGVRYGHLVESMRAEIEARGAGGRVAAALRRGALRGVIAKPKRLTRLFRLLRAYQRSGVQRLVRASHFLSLAPPLARMERMLLELGDPHRPPLVVPAKGQRRGRVAFFAGCVMPEIFGAANAATVAVLAQNGFEVEIPAGQVCCGALHLHAGDPVTAAQLHATNRAAFRLDMIDAVITNSAGCGAAMKDAGDSFSRKVRDATEFLADVGLRALPGALALRVAYDDPCHLLHGQRIAAAPRALLRSIPELELFDLPGHRDCCGAAGIYNLTQPAMAATLLARKVQAIRETAPQVVTTGNPGCLLQIGGGVAAAGLDVEVRHPLELLARAYGEVD
jgi:glycolate oxidase iron-sulfur subunit